MTILMRPHRKGQQESPTPWFITTFVSITSVQHTNDEIGLCDGSGNSFTGIPLRIGNDVTIFHINYYHSSLFSVYRVIFSDTRISIGTIWWNKLWLFFVFRYCLKTQRFCSVNKKEMSTWRHSRPDSEKEKEKTNVFRSYTRRFASNCLEFFKRWK